VLAVVVGAAVRVVVTRLAVRAIRGVVAVGIGRAVSVGLAVEIGSAHAVEAIAIAVVVPTAPRARSVNGIVVVLIVTSRRPSEADHHRQHYP
jgi:hypothetical protein